MQTSLRSLFGIFSVISRKGIPDVLELTYVNKNHLLDIPGKNRTFLPIKGLDYPNNEKKTDYILSSYPFVEHNFTNDPTV